MTRQELIAALALQFPHLSLGWIETAVKEVFAQLRDGLRRGLGIEIRGFGRFSLRLRPAKRGRNPKTGQVLALSGQTSLHFKASTMLLKKLNQEFRGPYV